MKRGTKQRPVHARPFQRPLRAGKRYTSRRIRLALQAKQDARLQRQWAKHPPTLVSQIDRAIETFVREVAFLGESGRMMGRWPRSVALTTPDPAAWGSPDFGLDSFEAEAMRRRIEGEE